MQNSVSNRLKQTIFSVCIATAVLGGVSSLDAKSCSSRTFNIKIADEVSASEILNQLSNECGFSIVTKDLIAREKLKNKLFGLNINKMSLDEIFNVLINVRGLNYSYRNKLLQISGLVTKTFKLDYVNSERTGTSNTDISLNGDSSDGEGESSEGTGTQSTGTTITSNDKFNFWTKMELELDGILNTPLDMFQTSSMPQQTVVSNNGNGTNNQQNNRVHSNAFRAPKPLINREAGLVTVTGTNMQVNRVSKYIDELMNRLHKQVLIDVQILSVKLDDSRQTGINWSEIYKLQNMKLNYEALSSNHVLTAVNGIADKNIEEWGNGLDKSSAQYFRFSGSTSITDLVKFLKTQGDVTSVSNPKVVTLNNQPAVFSSGDQLYYKLSAASRQIGTTAGAVGGESYNNEVVKSVFAGILLDITPEITDNAEIILKINPSISSVKSDVNSDSTGVRRLPPDLSKQQISSVVKLRDGEKIVLGGLIKSRKGTGEYKVPILGNLPLLGNAFKQSKIYDYREELVVIITPHIINHNRSSREIVSLRELGYQGIQ
jgi:general secretion pathway protein D